MKKKILLPLAFALLIGVGVTFAYVQKENASDNNGGTQLSIKVKDNGYKEQGKHSNITWSVLSNKKTVQEFRDLLDNTMKISKIDVGKIGCIYVDLNGKQSFNNTLKNAFLNKSFVQKYWENSSVVDILKKGVIKTYSDLKEDEYNSAIINAYWELLPDNTPNYFNGGESLTRGEAMTLLMRAVTKVESDSKPVSDSKFTKAVGSSDMTDYASYMNDFSYINTSDKSLNKATFSGVMTRGEYIYMLVKNIFGAEVLTKTDVKGVKLNDCSNAGDISKDKEFTGKSCETSNELALALQEPDGGAPKELYKALQVANKLGVISDETRWDEAITKSDAIDLFIDAMTAYTSINGYATTADLGTNAGDYYKDIAKAAFNAVTTGWNVDEAAYVNEYVSYINQGWTQQAVEETLYSKYSKQAIADVPADNEVLEVRSYYQDKVSYGVNTVTNFGKTYIYIDENGYFYLADKLVSDENRLTNDDVAAIIKGSLGNDSSTGNGSGEQATKVDPFADMQKRDATPPEGYSSWEEYNADNQGLEIHVKGSQWDIEHNGTQASEE